MKAVQSLATSEHQISNSAGSLRLRIRETLARVWWGNPLEADEKDGFYGNRLIGWDMDRSGSDFVHWQALVLAVLKPLGLLPQIWLILEWLADMFVRALLYHMCGTYNPSCLAQILTQHFVATKQILELDISLSHCEIYLESFECGELVPVSLFHFAVHRHMGLAFR